MKKIMKTLSLMFAVGAMLFGSGLHHEETKVARAEETIYSTALFGPDYNSKGISSYSSSWTAKNGNFTWNIANANNSNNGWNYIKMGSKKAASVGSISTSTAYPISISSVVMTIDKVTTSAINSIKLYVASDSEFSTNLTTYDGTIAVGDCKFKISSPSTNMFYKIEVDCKKSSNGTIQISKVNYMCESGKTLESIVVTQAKTEYTIGESISTEDLTVLGKYNDESEAEITSFTISPSGVLTETTDNMPVTISVGDVKTTYSIKVKEAPLFDKLLDINNLSIGDTVTLVSGNKAIGAQNGTIRSSVDGSFNDKGQLIYLASSISSFELKEGAVENSYSFFDGTGLLSWSSSNSLNTTTSSTVDVNSSWTIEINEEGVATILNCADSTRKLQYNASSPRFACYTSSQTSISIYYKPAITYTSLEISGTATTTKYYDGQEFNPEGLTVTAVSSDGTTRSDVTNAVEWSKLEVGATSVTATYKNLTATYNGITVEASKLLSIGVTAQPSKTTYFIGETLDVTGIVVTATYNFGTEVITEQVTYSHSKLSESGNITITVSFEEMTTTFNVTVNPLPTFGFPTISNTTATGLMPETSGSSTENSYFLAGIVTSVANTEYGNIYFKDAEGVEFYIYGTYLLDGTRYDAMSTKPQVGDAIVVYGAISNYKNGAQVKNAVLVSINNTILEETFKLASEVIGADACHSDEKQVSDFRTRYNALTSENQAIFNSITINSKSEYESDAATVTLINKLEYMETHKPTSNSEGLSSNLLTNITSSNNTIFVLVVGLLGLISIAGYYFLNKKKYSC